MIRELGEASEVLRVRETVPMMTATMARAKRKLRRAARRIWAGLDSVKQARMKRQAGESERK